MILRRGKGQRGKQNVRSAKTVSLWPWNVARGG